MKIRQFIRVFAAAVALLPSGVFAQEFSGQETLDSQEGHSHGKKVALAPSYAWKIMSPLGLREEATIDTLLLDYSRESIPSLISDAYATTGNLGAEGVDMIYEERLPMSDFFFRDAVEHWLPMGRRMKFYNTRIPMTLLSFNSSGGRETAQERLQATFSGNINAKAQVGALLDYLYSKGSYANQAAKNLSWGLSGSYIGDRYEFQGYYNHYNLVNKENGGITDILYITDPAELQGGVSTIDPKSIPTNLSNAHTRMSGNELLLNNRYKVGYWHEERDENDSIIHREYVAVSSFIYTLKYSSSKHLFLDDDVSELKDFFANTYLDNRQTRDRTTYWSLSNTVGVSLLEGFHKYAKFGLAAYITHEMRRYDQTPDTLDRTDPALGLTPFPDGMEQIDSRGTQQLAWVGGQLTKQRGSLLTYEATAQFGILGDAAGDVKIEGNVGTRFKILGDSVEIRGFGGFRNEAAPYLMNNFISNHFIWKNNFGKERTVEFGGTLNFRRTGTMIRIGVSNLQNHIYFGPDFLPVQHGSNVQVFSARLHQNFRVSNLHWDNTVTYQTTSDSKVVPLPTLNVYSNLYLLSHIATLNFQFGVDCDWYTSYYAPAYQPATASFGNQQETKLGNYPFMNVYANMKLKKARFYIMVSHVNQGLFGGSGYFSSPMYPLNPRRFQIGISVDFAN